MTRWHDLNPSNKRYYLYMGLGQITCALLVLLPIVVLDLKLILWAMR